MRSVVSKMGMGCVVIHVVVWFCPPAAQGFASRGNNSLRVFNLEIGTTTTLFAQPARFFAHNTSGQAERELSGKVTIGPGELEKVMQLLRSEGYTVHAKDGFLHATPPANAKKVTHTPKAVSPRRNRTSEHVPSSSISSTQEGRPRQHSALERRLHQYLQYNASFIFRGQELTFVSTVNSNETELTDDKGNPIAKITYHSSRSKFTVRVEDSGTYRPSHLAGAFDHLAQGIPLDGSLVIETTFARIYQRDMMLFLNTLTEGNKLQWSSVEGREEQITLKDVRSLVAPSK